MQGNSFIKEQTKATKFTRLIYFEKYIKPQTTTRRKKPERTQGNMIKEIQLHKVKGNNGKGDGNKHSGART